LSYKQADDLDMDSDEVML